METAVSVDLASWLRAHYPNILSEYETTGGLAFVVASGLAFNPARLALTLNGVDVPLTRLELKLVSLLWEKNGEAASRAEIVEAAWGDHYLPRIDDTRLEKLTQRLRKKIGDRLVTVKGYGYRLQA